MPLRLGTFNVWGLPGAFADDVSSRMRGLASRLPGLDLDVLFIQEAWTQEVRDTLREAALASNFEVAGGSSPGGGLMLFSRLPIRSTDFETFHFRGDPERLAQGEFLGGKGFQTVVLEGASGPLPVINTHLHARYSRAHPQLNSAVRMAQLLQLIGALKDLDGTVVLGGDFNCTHSDPEYKVFSELTHSMELGEGRSFPTLMKSNYYKRHRRSADKRVDYLFVRPGRNVECRSSGVAALFAKPERIRRHDRPLSDHYGFRAVFEPRSAAMHSKTGRSPVFDPKVFDLARKLLEIGREEADRRERAHFQLAGSWTMAAVAAASIRRFPALDRRSFLRSSAGVLAASALIPAIGYGTLARLDSDYKRDAFDDAHEILARIEARPHGAEA
jgi:endonuclease/exonuclease/phosphatase family metal-dependent hydrolase